MKFAEWHVLVMKNFEVSTSASGVIRVPCKICSTLIAGTTKSPANFLKHLKRKHAGVFAELSSLKQNIERSTETISPGEQKVSITPKKSIYSIEFKIRVMEFFFKHGGETNFGLKARTAQLFNIDKKTINRMLSNPEMVKKAYKSLNLKKPGSVVGQPVCRLPKPSKPIATSNLRPSSPQIHRDLPSVDAEEEVQVFDLPEDPDFSVLKKTINSSVEGVAGITKLLLTGTKEVQNIILQECDLILECKVCKNLFRSVVNLLAHKRIYCQEEFKDVKSLYHQDDALGMTTESNTVIVEPVSAPVEEPKKPKGIDQIAARLASTSVRSSKRSTVVSSSTDSGSSKFFKSIEDCMENRAQAQKDCSVVLKNISTCKGAVFQDILKPDEKITDETSQEILEKSNERKRGLTAILDSDGSIVDTCYGEPNPKNVCAEDVSESIDAESVESGVSTPLESVDANEENKTAERTIHTCPICNSQFWSMTGCLKHLLKVHKKKKHQRERLKQVIVQRTFKKSFPQSEMAKYRLKNAASSTNQPMFEASKTNHSDVDQLKSANSLIEFESPKIREVHEKWQCNVCHRIFLCSVTATAHTATHTAGDFEPRAVRIFNDHHKTPNVSIDTNQLTDSSPETDYARLIRECFASNQDKRPTSPTDTNSTSVPSTKYTSADTSPKSPSTPISSRSHSPYHEVNSINALPSIQPDSNSSLKNKSLKVSRGSSHGSGVFRAISKTKGSCVYSVKSLPPRKSSCEVQPRKSICLETTEKIRLPNPDLTDEKTIIKLELPRAVEIDLKGSPANVVPMVTNDKNKELISGVHIKVDTDIDDNLIKVEHDLKTEPVNSPDSTSAEKHQALLVPKPLAIQAHHKPIDQMKSAVEYICNQKIITNITSMGFKPITPQRETHSVEGINTQQGITSRQKRPLAHGPDLTSPITGSTEICNVKHQTVSSISPIHGHKRSHLKMNSVITSNKDMGQPVRTIQMKNKKVILINKKSIPASVELLVGSEEISVPSQEPTLIEPSTSTLIECSLPANDLNSETPRNSLLNCCPKCKRNFLTGGALGSHLKYCQFPPLSPLPLHEMPEKKIEIQIRKSYQKDGIPPSPASNDPIPQLLIRRSRSDEWVSSVQDRELTPFQSKLEEEIAANSQVLRQGAKNGKLKCNPCKRKFTKASHFRVHVAKHLDCTRFKCLQCNQYRSYHRYCMLSHALTAHKLNSEKAKEIIIADERIGEFSYNLPEKKESDKQAVAVRNDTQSTVVSPDVNGKLCEDIKKEVDEDVTTTPAIAATTEIKLEPSTTDPVDTDLPASRQERPQRLRRTVEKKDFVYDTRKLLASNSEEESIKVPADSKNQLINDCSSEETNEPDSSNETLTNGSSASESDAAPKQPSDEAPQLP